MIWLVSYPKSGNTWLRILFALARFGDRVDVETLVGQLTDYSPWEADRKWFEPLLGKPWAQARGPDFLQVRSQAQAAMEAAFATANGADALVKSHNMVAKPNGTALFPAGEGHRAIHLVRNPLDVAVSLKHHMDMPEENVVRVLTNADMVARRTKTCVWEKYGSWRGHTTSWLEQAPYPSFHLRYEDLVARDAGKLAAAFTHAGIEFDASLVPGLFDGTAIDTLRAAEDKVGFTEIPSKLKNFFRKGETGAWKTELSAEARNRIVAECRELMDHFGFEY